MLRYKVWQEDDGEKSARQREANDPEDAAAEQADYDYLNRGGWEHSWPVMYVVEDDATGMRWRVKVDLDFDPVFHAAEVKDGER
jgi:hypothetical protein